MPTPFLLAGQKADIPCGYHELSLGQFIDLSALADHSDICAVLEIFTGVKKKVWNDADLNSLSVALLNEALSWVSKKVEWNKLPVPQKVTLKGKEVTVPKKLETKTFGQRSAFDRFITNNIKVDMDGNGTLTPELMTDAIAIYLQPEYTGEKFNPDKLGEMKEIVDALPVTEAVPLATFFLRQLIGLKSVRLKFDTQKMRTMKQPVLNNSHVLET